MTTSIILEKSTHYNENSISTLSFTLTVGGHSKPLTNEEIEDSLGDRGYLEATSKVFDSAMDCLYLNLLYFMDLQPEGRDETFKRLLALIAFICIAQEIVEENQLNTGDGVNLIVKHETFSAIKNLSGEVWMKYTDLSSNQLKKIREHAQDFKNYKKSLLNFSIGAFTSIPLLITTASVGFAIGLPATLILASNLSPILLGIGSSCAAIASLVLLGFAIHSIVKLFEFNVLPAECKTKCRLFSNAANNDIKGNAATSRPEAGDLPTTNERQP